MRFYEIATKTTLFFSALVLFSCSKEQLATEKTEETVQDSRFAVEGDYLRFTDKAAFQSVIDELKEVPTSGLGEWEQKHGFARSRRAAQKDTTNPISEEECLPDQRFAALLNPQGIIAIGDSAYRATKSYSYSAALGNVNELRTIAPGNTLKSDKVTVFKVIDHLAAKGPLKLSGTSMIPWKSNGDAKGSVMISMSAWSNTYTFYSSNGIAVLKRFRAQTWYKSLYWKDSPAGRIYLKGTATYSDSWVSFAKVTSDDVDYNEYNEECMIVSTGSLTFYTHEIDAYFEVDSMRFQFYF